MRGRHEPDTGLNVERAVLTWNEPWTTRDGVWITAALDAIPNGVCIFPPFGGYIGVWLKVAEPSSFARAICGGRWTKDVPSDRFPEMQVDEHDEWHEPSTFRLNPGGPTIPELGAEIFPRGFMELLLTGVCDCN